MKQRLPIVHRPLPVDAHPFTFSIAWNVQLSRDPAHQGFRTLIGNGDEGFWWATGTTFQDRRTSADRP